MKEIYEKYKGKMGVILLSSNVKTNNWSKLKESLDANLERAIKEARTQTLADVEKLIDEKIKKILKEWGHEMYQRACSSDNVNADIPYSEANLVMKYAFEDLKKAIKELNINAKEKT